MDNQDTSADQQSQPVSQPGKINRINIKGKRKVSKTDLIIRTAAEHPDLTLAEIGKIAECSKVNVYTTLQRYGVNQKELKDYQDNSKAYWDAATQKSLAAYLRLTPEETKGLLLKRGLVDAGIASDKATGADKTSAVLPMVIINKISLNGKVEGDQQVIDIQADTQSND